MSIYEYIQLPLKDRANKVWNDGEFLFNVKDEKCSYSLYLVGSFYVEVTNTDDDGIIDITPFTTGDRLDKYLTQIEVK